MTRDAVLDEQAKKHADAVRALGGEATTAEVAKHLCGEYQPTDYQRTWRSLERAVKLGLLLRIYGGRAFRFRSP